MDNEHRARGQGSDHEEDGVPTSEPVTGPEVRIDAPEAGVVAGLTPDEDSSGPGSVGGASRYDSPASGEPTEVYELPDWADPPTGQVPRILLDDAVSPDEPIVRGPSWRESSSDWGDDLDLSVLVSDDEDVTQIAGRAGPPTEAPFEFAFAEVDDSGDDDQPWQPLLADSAAATQSSSKRRHSRRRPVQTRRAEPAVEHKKSALVATSTGVGLLGLAVLCFLGGTPSALALVALVLALAAGEAFAAFQREGFRPATLIGLLAVPALVIGSYLKGPEAIAIVFGAAFVLTGIWYVAKGEINEPIGDISATLLVIGWIGVLGSFAGLLLTPRLFPERHGLAILLGAILLTASYDIGAYALGSWRGRHHVAPKISPSKTIEGLLGGTVATLVVGALGISHLHPFDIGRAIVLALIVSIFAPLGDLFESLIKRDLGVKDMGTLLPGHGGVLDRIDAMLFVMVPTYCFVRLVHF